MFDPSTWLPLEVWVGLVGVVVALVLYLLFIQLDVRMAARSSLRQLDEYDLGDHRQKKLLIPLHHRLLKRVARWFAQVGSRLNPPDYVERVNAKHIAAGVSGIDKVERFLAFRILGFCFIPVWLMFTMILNPLNLAGMMQLGFAAAGVVAGAVGPASRLDKKVKERQASIQRSLPDVLDLLVIAVESGLGFEQALDRVIENVPGDLADEFSRVLGEARAGASRSDALRSMQERVDIPEIRSFVLAMIQADTFGISIGKVLRGQADELRIKRQQWAQEKAQKAPIKMMVPMVFCIFPALFVVVIGPAVINISKSF